MMLTRIIHVNGVLCCSIRLGKSVDILRLLLVVVVELVEVA